MLTRGFLCIFVSNFMMYTTILLIQCPDQKGIISDVTSFVYEHKGNIVYIDQYVDRENAAFFMRLEAELDEEQFPHKNIYSSLC